MLGCDNSSNIADRKFILWLISLTVSGVRIASSIDLTAQEFDAPIQYHKFEFLAFRISRRTRKNKKKCGNTGFSRQYRLAQFNLKHSCMDKTDLFQLGARSVTSIKSKLSHCLIIR